MRDRIAVLGLVFALLGSGSIAALNNKTVIPVGSDLYTFIDSLYIESGRVPPNSTRPWTADEMIGAAERLSPEELSAAGRQMRTYLIEYFKAKKPVFNEEQFSFDSRPSVSVEGFYHGLITDTTDTAPQAYEWIHGYEERQPFLSIPLEFWYGDSLYMTSDIVAKEEYRAVTSPSTPDVADNYANVLFDDPNIWLDLYFPFRAVLSTGGEWWNIFFGRDTLSWGGGTSGNLLLSDYSDFYDFVSLSFFSPSFKMTTLYSVFDRFLPDGTDIDYGAFVAHRFEMRFTERVSLTITEAVTFANLRPELVRDLNFLMVYHSWTVPERMNSLMTAELAINPWKYFTVYGHFALDEFSTPYEEDRGGGGGPPVYGYLLGARGAYPLGPGYLDLVVEGAQTSPWLYNRRAAPYYYNVRRYWSVVTENTEYITKPLGYEYGPDAIVFFLAASYRVPESFGVELEVERILKGEKDVGAPWDPAPGDLPPTGVPEKKWVVHLGGSWTPFSYVQVGAAINWSHTDNPLHLEGESRSDAEVTAYVNVGL